MSAGVPGGAGYGLRAALGLPVQRRVADRDDDLVAVQLGIVPLLEGDDLVFLPRR